MSSESTAQSCCILTVTDAENMHTEYNLEAFGKRRITFGRAQDNDIVIDSPIVSRHHGYFELAGKAGARRCYITDSDSTNGTYVNGAAVSTLELTDGAAIRIDDLAESCMAGIMMIYSSVADDAGWIEHPIGEREVTIGRSEDCDIVIDHVSVSKVHARARKSGNDYILHVEKQTKNSGVTINGVSISGDQIIRDMDVICIANAKLIFSQGAFSYKTERKGLELDAVNIAKRVTIKGKRRWILDDTTISIKPCEFVAIIGGSGSGKSTLMNCINGFDKPTVGKVLVNGVDLYSNYEALKNVIGYVPQQDIVHENLTLFDMLKYVAKLRMPPDTAEEEYDSRVSKVISMVELDEHKNKIIRTLSGGQKKRASIAVELIADPALFFLDEPSSGLDPGTERSLMKLLQRMSRQGKTIITITHNTQNLNLCDKIIVLGAGGYMAYFGPPVGAKEFFGVEDFVDVYNLVESDPQGWEIRFNNSALSHTDDEIIEEEQVKQERKHSQKPFWNQTLVLAQRYLNIIWNDKMRMLFLLLQGPLIAYLFSMVSVSNTYSSFMNAQSMLFALSCASIWVGLMNAIQEICKERNILRREYMTDMRLDSYIVSKLLVLSIMAFLQSLLMMLVFSLTIGVPATSAIGSITFDAEKAAAGLAQVNSLAALGKGAFWEMLFTVFLVTMSSSSLGLLVSAISKNPDRAMVLAPILLIPQLLFSGILFYLNGVTEVISWVCASRWSMEALGSIADLNSVYRYSYRVEYYNELYALTPWHLISTWLVLIATIAGFSLLSIVMLMRVKHDKR